MNKRQRKKNWRKKYPPLPKDYLWVWVDEAAHIPDSVYKTLGGSTGVNSDVSMDYTFHRLVNFQEVRGKNEKN